jgi:hypothetical protein
MTEQDKGQDNWFSMGLMSLVTRLNRVNPMIPRGADGQSIYILQPNTHLIKNKIAPGSSSVPEPTVSVRKRRQRTRIRPAVLRDLAWTGPEG